jgi:hypothetical protein
MCIQTVTRPPAILRIYALVIQLPLAGYKGYLALNVLLDYNTKSNSQITSLRLSEGVGHKVAAFARRRTMFCK